MTASSKRRFVARYEAAMDRLVEHDEESVDLVSDYVEWLKSQITRYRHDNQALKAQLAEHEGV